MHRLRNTAVCRRHSVIVDRLSSSRLMLWGIEKSSPSPAYLIDALRLAINALDVG